MRKPDTKVPGFQCGCRFRHGRGEVELLRDRRFGGSGAFIPVDVDDVPVGAQRLGVVEVDHEGVVVGLAGYSLTS